MFFSLDLSSSTFGNWTQIGLDISPYSSSGPDFLCGRSIDISNDGTKVIIGCPSADVNNAALAGTVHIYNLARNDNVWNEVATLVGNTADMLGFSVLFGMIPLLGKPFDGSVLQFSRQ